MGKAPLPHNKRNCYPPYPDHYLNHIYFVVFFKVSVAVVILVNIYLLFTFLNFFYKKFYYCNFVIFRFTLVSTLVIINVSEKPSL